MGVGSGRPPFFYEGGPEHALAARSHHFALAGAGCLPDRARPARQPPVHRRPEAGHGTHVAGIIAARDNSTGVVGVAPGATIYAVKALDDNGNGYWSTVICAVDWTMQNPGLVRVANLSLGGSGTATPSNLDCTNAN